MRVESPRDQHYNILCDEGVVHLQSNSGLTKTSFDLTLYFLNEGAIAEILLDSLATTQHLQSHKITLLQSQF